MNDNMQDNTIEWVAKAIVEANDGPFDMLGEAAKDIARKEARAAVEALMVPSDAVLAAMHDGPLMADDHEMDEKTKRWLVDMWKAGLRAVLSDTGDANDV